MIQDRLAEVLTKRFQEEDLADCFLVDIKSHPKNKVEVFVESDDVLTIDKCRKISRFLENEIEERGWMPDKYTLDVSSPGLDNPLKLHRQYIKNVGRKIGLKVNDEVASVSGKLLKVTDSHITVEQKKSESVEIPFDKIIEAKILVSFK